MLTPEEVKGHGFTKAPLGGYNMGQVDEFLDVLTGDYTTLYSENTTLKRKMKVMQDKIDEYRNTEETMRKALLEAQKIAENMVQEGKAKTQKLMDDAQNEIETLRRSTVDEREQEEHRLQSVKQVTAQYVEQVRALHRKEQEYLDSLGILLTNEQGSGDYRAAAEERPSPTMPQAPVQQPEPVRQPVMPQVPLAVEPMQQPPIQQAPQTMSQQVPMQQPPMQQAPQAPMQQAPQAPMQQAPQAPMQQAPQAPMQQPAQAPVQQAPQAPMQQPPMQQAPIQQAPPVQPAPQPVPVQAPLDAGNGEIEQFLERTMAETKPAELSENYAPYQAPVQSPPVSTLPPEPVGYQHEEYIPDPNQATTRFFMGDEMEKQMVGSRQRPATQEELEYDAEMSQQKNSLDFSRLQQEFGHKNNQ